MKVRILSVLLLGFFTMGAGYQNDNAPLSPRMEEWVTKLAHGFTKTIKKESPNIWYDCGVQTPEKDWYSRSKEIATETMKAMRRHKLRVDPCGVIATAYNESRGNRCSIGPRTRNNAKKLGLYPEDKKWRELNQEDILKILKNEKWINRKYMADVGIYQDVYPNYARIIDNGGALKCIRGHNMPCRIPLPEELLTVAGSAEVGIHGMLSRFYFFKTKEPWFYWPWTVRANYSKAIAKTMKDICG